MSPPRPVGSDHVDHGPLDPILNQVATGGVLAIDPARTDLHEYLQQLKTVEPNRLTPAGALAFWINLYNGHAIDLARRADASGHQSVLEVGKGFSGPVTTIGGEDLSLEGIEHGKIRRFADPRIHAALVCGSVSCPTLRFEAYREAHLDHQLDDQMRHFLAAGAFAADQSAGIAHLSRVFLWYGADFVRPRKMPTLVPAPKRRIALALGTWLKAGDAEWLANEKPKIRFQDYNWGLGCAVRSRPETA